MFSHFLQLMLTMPLRLVFVLLALLLVAGCQNRAAVPAPAAPPTTAESVTSPDSPSTSSGPSDATSTPLTTVNGEFRIPSPSDPTKANLGGTLIRLAVGEETGVYPDAVLYLGKVVYNEAGEKIAAGFTETDPKAETDDQGRFVFYNVEPGEYALFFWTPLGSVMLLNPESGGDMLFELKPGDAVDTGPLRYEIPYN